MENLSRLVGPVPVTSQSAGNTTSDNSAAMTAAGSASETAPEPQPWMGMAAGEAIEVNPQRDRITGNAAPGGDGPWQQPGYMDEGASDGAGWRQT